MAPLALVTNLLSRLSHLHCHIALDCPIGIITKWHNLHWSPGCITASHCLELTLSVSIELVSSSARVTSVKFQKGLRLSQFFTFWVPIYISGSLFSVFWQIHAKNVNSVCKHVTMSKLDLCCLKQSFALGNGFHICGTGSVLYC